ncbi:MAG: T9SS type A sorting domain-containing protein [Bacteroidales bacterium]|nr:T9SS type A sorting domain-containing protein [Bacteroidales bacterium]
MKKILLSGLLICLASILYCQISILRSDVFNLGDEFPRIYYSFEAEGNGYHIDSVLTNPVVFDDLRFPFIEIDTLVYTSPSETDSDGIYADATCSFWTRDGFIMHLLITDEQMRLIGVQGQLPMTGDPMNLVFTDTLILSNFPSTFGSSHQDTGSGFEKQHISVFESIIPSEYYGLFSGLYDTVRFKMDFAIHAEYDEFGIMQCVGDSNLNGSFHYLRENRQLINVFDIQLREKSSGVFSSIGDNPLIAAQLHVELPMIDTTTSYAYWTKGNKNPLAEIEMNTGRDSVYNVTYRYAFLSSSPNFEMIKHSVFPNPADNYFTLNIADFNNQKLEIYSIEGKKIEQIILSSQSSKIDIADMSNGTYIYKILDKNNKAVAGGKFVKN